jgi:hypothetical protein
MVPEPLLLAAPNAENGDRKVTSAGYAAEMTVLSPQFNTMPKVSNAVSAWTAVTLTVSVTVLPTVVSELLLMLTEVPADAPAVSAPNTNAIPLRTPAAHIASRVRWRFLWMVSLMRVCPRHGAVRAPVLMDYRPGEMPRAGIADEIDLTRNLATTARR